MSQVNCFTSHFLFVWDFCCTMRMALALFSVCACVHMCVYDMCAHSYTHVCASSFGMHMCIKVYVYVCAHARGYPKSVSSVFLSSPSMWVSHWTWMSLVLLGWQTSQVSGTAALFPQCWSDRQALMCDSSTGTWDLISVFNIAWQTLFWFSQAPIYFVWTETSIYYSDAYLSKFLHLKFCVLNLHRSWLLFSYLTYFFVLESLCFFFPCYIYLSYHFVVFSTFD